MLCSPVGSFWRLRTCLGPGKVSCCPLCPLAGKSVKTTWGESTLSTTRAEPHSGNDPQCSRSSPSVQAMVHHCHWWYNTDVYTVCVCVSLTGTVMWRRKEDRGITRTWSKHLLPADRSQTLMKTPQMTPRRRSLR